MRSGLRRAINQTKTPVAIPSRYQQQAATLFRNDDRELLLHAMAALPDVYGLVSLNASSVAKVKWHLYRKQADNRRRYGPVADQDRQEVLVHPGLYVWDNPNDFHTQRAYIEGFSQHLELTGEAYWVFSYVGSMPTAMYYVMPHRMQPVPSTTTLIQGWIYTDPDGQQHPLKLSEVIGPPTLSFPCPWDVYHGLSPVAAALVDIRNARASGEWSANFFLNNAFPGGWIEIPNSWSDPEFDEWTDRMRESHRGVANAGRIGILEHGATFKPNQQSMRDMQFAETRKISGDNIRRGFRTHKHMLGDSDDVNRANAETAEETHSRWQTTDRLDRIKDTLNGPFLKLFKSQGQVEFDYENPVPDDREADNSELTSKTGAYATLVGAGVDPVDAAEVVGLPPMNMAPKPEPPPAAPPPDPSQDPTLPPDATEEDQAMNQITILRRALSNGYSLGGKR
jgi:phage portal protein BeeE